MSADRGTVSALYPPCRSDHEFDFDALYAQCRRRLHNLVRRRVPFAAIGDVEQQTWMKIVARRETWVLRFAHDEIRDWWREEKAWRRAGGQSLAPPERLSDQQEYALRAAAERPYEQPDAAFEARAEEYEAAEAVRAILRELDPRLVRIGVFIVDDGLTQERAAKKEGLSARAFRNLARTEAERLGITVQRRRRSRQ
jgi:DNA-directed RNA polymerase specialized sigma24 family protein